MDRGRCTHLEYIGEVTSNSVEVQADVGGNLAQRLLEALEVPDREIEGVHDNSKGGGYSIFDTVGGIEVG